MPDIKQKTDLQMCRSLFNHGLENLLFEKRSRKSTQAVFPSPIPASKSNSKIKTSKEPCALGIDIESKQQIQRDKMSYEVIEKEQNSRNKRQQNIGLSNNELTDPLQKAPQKKRGRPLKNKPQPIPFSQQLECIQIKLPQEQNRVQISHPQTHPQAQIQAQDLQMLDQESVQEGKSNKLVLELKGLLLSSNNYATKSSRRTKGSEKRYTEDEIRWLEESGDSNVSEKYGKSRRRIAKNRKSKGVNEDYCLNRIFRKDIKKDYPSFEVTVNIQEVNLLKLVEQVGLFDIIHCSLPLQLLLQLSGVEKLSEKGFIFVWASRGDLPIGYALLNRWGYDVIDQIMWIKTKPGDNCIAFNESEEDGELFLNCRETCMVGYKCAVGQKANYRTKISNNIIFADESVHKPAQIYDIADLMMPKGRKLEIGGKPVSSWLTLQHHDTSIRRCRDCFRNEHLCLIKESGGLLARCRSCIDKQSEEEEEIEMTERPIEIISFEVFCKEDDLVCSECGDGCKEYVNDANALLCKKCFSIRDPNLHSVVVLVKEKIHFSRCGGIKCSECHSAEMVEKYFECSKCKGGHIMCQECFWKCGASHDNKHFWRPRPIITTPGVRCYCVGCKHELELPFWCCRTCINWYWCGSCDGVGSDIHAHNRNGGHLQYLMI